MYTLTTIDDLETHITPLLGKDAEQGVIRALAEAIWGTYRVGDLIEIPGDLADLYVQIERVTRG